MVRLCHVVVVVGFCALPAYAQLRGDCRVAGGASQFCDPKGVACTASDGKSGTCVQYEECECVPHNVCHLEKSTGTYAALRIPAAAIRRHLTHGDCEIDDGVDCTIDRCDPSLGCVHSPDDARCDDSDACTTDSCNAITGCVYVAVNCDDSDACTTDSCNAITGCVYVAVNCDDSDACTTDSCNAITGCVYVAVNCDDGNDCTDDTCDPQTGCVSTPSPTADDDTIFNTDGTIAFDCPALGGRVQIDTIRPFSIPADGITGFVQDRVLLSDEPFGRDDPRNPLHFYWRVHNDATSLNSINYFTRHNFAGFTDSVCGITIDYRPDGVGDIPPEGENFNSALQTDGYVRLFTPLAGANDDIPPGQESRFIVIITNATAFGNGSGCGVIYGPTSSAVIFAHEPQ